MKTFTRVRVAAAVLPIALAGLAACAPPTPTPVDPTPVVLSSGHVDIGLAVEDGELEPHIHAHDTDEEYAPAGAVLTVLPAAATTVSSDPAFSFLGAPGAAVHVLPETQVSGLLFLGLGAEEIEDGVLIGDQYDVSVVSVAGPGSFSIFTTDGLGVPTVLVNSGDGLPDVLAGLPVGVHSHANFAFTAPGTYTVEFEFTGTLVDGDVALDSGPVAYTFDVQA